MPKPHNQPNPPSEDELNQQINDKLSELWSGMRNKKRQLLRNLTPGYSRRSERTVSELNATHTHTNLTNGNLVTDNQLLRMKEKLASEESGRKLKQSQIQRLKGTIAQLTNDKKILVREIQNMTGQSMVSVGQLDDQRQEDERVDGRTANFCAKNERKKRSEVFSSKKNRSCTQESANKENVGLVNNKMTRAEESLKQSDYNNSLQDLSKARLIELLRSTSQYREFAFYYDSHQLSYLKRLQQQHKKNCQVNHSQVERRYWTPSELYNRMRQKNASREWGLSETQLQEVIGEMKGYFEASEEVRVKETKEYYLKRMEKMKRQKENKVPYDLVRLSNARERQICKKRAKSIRS